MSGQRRLLAFPRAARLLNSEDFQAIFKRPVVVNDRLFRVYARALGPSVRLGLAISRKAAPRAVDRNRIKRQIREVFRHQRLLLAGDGGVEFIVMARAEARSASGAELRTAIKALFNRAATRARAVTEA